LDATHYHVAVCDYLERHEPDLWRWGASAAQDDLQAVRLHLLKTTYQLSGEAHPALHDAAARVARALGISPAVSLYQSNDGGGANAAIYTGADEVHIVFQGPVLGMLDAAETEAVLAHELSHYLLWRRDGGRYLCASRILDRLACEESPPGVWASTALR
jgi:Zn-dependent protease with chaperone function